MPILGVIASSTRQGQVTVDTGAMFPLGSIYLSTASASISFTSIPSTYSHLHIRYTSRNAAATDTTLIRFNSDSGSNYSWHQLRGNGTQATGAASATPPYIELPWTTYSGLSANYYGIGVVDILDYANTNKFKTVRSIGGADVNGSGTIGLYTGHWKNTNAINTITIFPASGNFEPYTQFSLYGVKSA